MSSLKFCICLVFALTLLGCGDSAKDSTPKVVGDPKNSKFASPASDGPSGATKNVSNDKTANTP